MANIGNIISTVGSALGAVNPLLSLGGSILGGLLGSKGQSNANKANLQMARETNAANRANQEYQNEWNLEMWNKQNAYNAPAAQRSRLEAAGMNPIFSGLDGTGNAGALTSAEYTATPGAPMLNSGEFMANGIMNAAKTMAEVDLLNSQKKKTDNETDTISIGNEILNAQKPALIENEFVSLQINKKILELKPLEKEKLSKEVDLLSQNIEIATENKEILRKQKLSFEQDKLLDSNLKIAQTQDLYNQIAYRIYQSAIEERRISLDEAMYWPELLELMSRVDLNIETLSEMQEKAFRHFASFGRQAQKDYLEMDKVASEIGVNRENIKYVGKKGEYYEYEVILNGVKSLLLVASMLL